MKAHLTKVSLALLSTVFLFGCQDMGSGPVGLEGLGPEFDRPFRHDCEGQVDGHCHDDEVDVGDATYTADFLMIGDVTGSIALLSDLQTLAGELSFSIDFIGAINDGSTCFPNGGPFTGTLGIGVAKKNDPGDAVMLFSFDAESNDGTGMVVNYGLFLFGTAGGKLPPDADNSTTINWTTFDMHHSNGPGNKVSCNGMGFLPNTTTTEVTKN